MHACWRWITVLSGDIDINDQLSIDTHGEIDYIHVMILW
jgi:hypothetical protein